ncbi:MAG: hypothetical protein U5K71_04070 [Gracilimonas sp.]|nr:hypothetical protein [Gracilimonas sp.]
MRSKNKIKVYEQLNITYLYSCPKFDLLDPGTFEFPGIEPGVSLELAQFRKANISDITYELYFNIPSEKTESIEASGNDLI